MRFGKSLILWASHLKQQGYGEAAEQHTKERAFELIRLAAEMAQRQAAELHTELDRAHEQLRQLRAQLAAVSARRSSAETDVDVTRAELDELTARAAAAEADAASQAGRLAALEAELRDSRALLVEARDRRDEPAPDSDGLAAAEQRARDAEERIRVLEAHTTEAERLRAKLERGSNARRPLAR